MKKWGALRQYASMVVQAAGEFADEHSTRDDAPHVRYYRYVQIYGRPGFEADSFQMLSQAAAKVHR